ncbi:DUF484 family protein [Paraburkholderia unamae]|uniref:DUF484 family protein n=1 Tax=Paraburkholderia unamae TaxID=219649 RepID=A0ABX5KXV4_9BURK|nr:DUF484 family protein [Paraburkholderia unamae]PVX97601.1 hypothetical protein C7402_101314 [Paraburkholderia unamae]RAR66940.1 hypothetical protein C7401_102367 [Paraburkholderia unamae]CAG9274498.1 conserved hypothetical protein [Paraburkholderia unamae]
MNDREVADYLLAHPDFFVEHAELLATIKLGNPHGKAAVSLQERQMEMLREKNKHLERRLSELLRYGHENDSIAAKFNRWTTRMIAERDPYALPRSITQNLRDVFDMPQAALRVWDVAEAYAQADFARHTGEEVRIFASSLDTPYCGANTGFEAAQWLDASDGAAQSVAIIALRAPVEASNDAPQSDAFGLLVMGSPDSRRFHDGMATDFLTQIGALASAALSRLLPH